MSVAIKSNTKSTMSNVPGTMPINCPISENSPIVGAKNSQKADCRFTLKCHNVNRT